MTRCSPSTSPLKHVNNDNDQIFLNNVNNGSPSLQLKRRRLASHSVSVVPIIPELASRVIIALDLDAFYVSACRKRDPSLIGIPIGIQQKALVATISYEARVAGVDKLDSIKDALKKCPDMVLVNGEDLTYFRQVSSQVWRLVRSIVWDKTVEKLGMDELFCDVTQMIDHHLASLHTANVGGGERWFDLNPPGDGEKADGYGFGYQAWPSESPGHTFPSDAAEFLVRNSPDWWQQRMLAAAQLAYYLRQRISNEVGLTCSAGIAPSKSLAKLVGALHKPNHQTVFCPPILGPLKDPEIGERSEDARLLHHINTFLDPLDLRKLPGFGRVVVDKVRDHLHPHPATFRNQDGGRTRSNFMDPISISDDEGNKSKVKVTVGAARKMLSVEQMVALFGDVIGPKLWALVCGRDAEPVIPAPDFPLQLSIEDTYPFPSLRGPAIHAEIRRLSVSLLRRLELELTHQPSVRQELSIPISQETTIKSEQVIIRDYEEEKVIQKSGGWLRYPMKLRLSVRQGWSNRVSKQTKMPVEIFELEQPRDVRAAAIAKACTGLLRALIGGDDVVGDGINLINIAALELSEKRPQRALGSFFATATSISKDAKPKGATSLNEQGQGRGHVDEEFLASLPPELRDEISREYGLDLPSEVACVDSHKILDTRSDEDVGTANKVDTKAKGKATSLSGLTCGICEEEMEVWMQHDHELYPISGLPSSSSPSQSWTASEDGLDEESEGGGEDPRMES